MSSLAVAQDPGPDAARNAPVVILVRPQLGQNIGAAARAMGNCGLAELRLVAPRDGWPNTSAYSAAGHADAVLNNAVVFPDVASASADLHWVYATTARPRDLVKPVLHPRQAAAEMRAAVAARRRVGVLFGPERTGLENAETAAANALINAPLVPGAASLNLAQAVLLVGYEWYVAGDAAAATAPARLDMARTPPASQADLAGLMEHLTRELDAANYFAAAPEKRPTMLDNIAALFARAGLFQQDVRTFRGMIKALAEGRPLRPRRSRQRGGPPDKP
jgi:tRNA/rRNA methyltransferase